MARKRKGSVTARQELHEEFAELAQVAKEFDAFRPAPQVLKRVRAVPTWFIQLDYGWGVGGCPIDRAGLLHGPSSEGKTALSIGLLGSFLGHNHLARLIDAERTTPITWCEELLGRLSGHPFFGALRPKTYEEAREAVLQDFTKLKKLRDAGKIPAHTSGLVVVDSIRKLTPAGIFNTISQEAQGKVPYGGKKKGIDGMGGRAAQIKAAMNASWMDELVPLLDDTGTGFLAIARETPGEKGEGFEIFEDGAERHIKIGGGQGLVYDASYRLRSELVGPVFEEMDGGKKRVIGERFCVSIHKLKVAAKKTPVVRTYFHTSNGEMAGVPVGFDRPRDLLELGERLGVIKSGGGGWFSYNGHRLGQGRNNVVASLHRNQERFLELDKAVRAAFPKQGEEPKSLEEVPGAQAG